MPNTIAQNLQRLQVARTNIANAITEMGGTVNTGDGFEAFPADILTIPTGGGDIQFSHLIGYASELDSYSTQSVGVYNPSSCSIRNASSTGYAAFMMSIITTSSNVFICIPVIIYMNKDKKSAHFSYYIPSTFPSKYGYNANTMTLYSYYNRPTIGGTGSCAVHNSFIYFYVNTASADNTFGDFILKFDKT